MRKNEKGSSLIFAVVVIMVIAITIAAALAISFSYYNRSIAANSERQAYLTAKSVLTNIVDNIDAENKEYLDLIPDGITTLSKTLEIADFPSDLGKIDDANLSITQRIEGDVVKDVLTISVTATYSNQTKILNADFKRTKGKKAWNFEKYYEGEKTSVGKNIIMANDLIDAIEPLKLYAEEIFSLDKEPEKSNKKKEFAQYIFQQSNGTIESKDTNVLDNTTILRPYVYNIIQKGKAAELDINEFKLPTDLHAIYKNKKLYIHVMFGFKSGKAVYIIYADESESGTAQQWNPTFVYLQETGHWYFNTKYNYNGTKVTGSEFPGMAGLNGETTVDATYKSIIDLCVPDNIAQ